MADDRILFRAANERFWSRTNYKPGEKLDMTIAKDREMAKIWLDIYNEVRGHRERATALARGVYGETSLPYVLIAEKVNGGPLQQAFQEQGQLDVHFAWAAGHPEQYTYAAMFDFTKDQRGPLRDHFSSAQSTVGAWWDEIAAIPNDVIRDQVERWVAYKDAEYMRFGATAEQRTAWAEYNRKRYTAFLTQQRSAA